MDPKHIAITFLTETGQPEHHIQDLYHLLLSAGISVHLYNKILIQKHMDLHLWGIKCSSCPSFLSSWGAQSWLALACELGVTVHGFILRGPNRLEGGDRWNDLLILVVLTHNLFIKQTDCSVKLISQMLMNGALKSEISLSALSTSEILPKFYWRYIIHSHFIAEMLVPCQWRVLLFRASLWKRVSGGGRVPLTHLAAWSIFFIFPRRFIS